MSVSEIVTIEPAADARFTIAQNHDDKPGMQTIVIRSRFTKSVKDSGKYADETAFHAATRKAIQIPDISQDFMAELISEPEFFTALSEILPKYFKAAFAQYIQEHPAQLSVPLATFSGKNILAQMLAEPEDYSGHLGTEKATKIFDLHCVEFLKAKFTESGIPEAMHEGNIKAYRALFCKLSSKPGKGSPFDAAEFSQLTKLVNACFNEDTPAGEFIIGKFNAFKGKESAVSLNLL